MFIYLSGSKSGTIAFTAYGKSYSLISGMEKVAKAYYVRRFDKKIALFHKAALFSIALR